VTMIVNHRESKGFHIQECNYDYET
jgi:hypothetical protein